MRQRNRSHSLALRLGLGGLFFLSGAPALVYQVAWQRILVLQGGAGIYAVTLVVAAFLAGLGIGNIVGGRLSLSRTPRRAIRAFAGLELITAGFAASSGFFFYELPLVYGRGLLPTWAMLTLSFLALLPPTVVMGMTLPLLVKGLVYDPRTASRDIGWLYGANVLGAAVGAASSPWILFPRFGLLGTLWIGAFVNLSVGVLAWIFARGVSDRTTAAETDNPPSNAFSLSPTLGTWGMLYALSGLLAIGLEILWFRLIDVAGKGTAFTFGTNLALYLAGLGIGGFAGGLWAPRITRPLRGFLLCQIGVLAYAAIGAIVLVHAPETFPPIAALREFGRGYAPLSLTDPQRNTGLIALVYIGLPLGLFGPATFLMGIAFALLQKGVQDSLTTSGYKVGLLQGVNIAGNVAGSLLVGLAGLTLLGSAATLRALVAIGLAFPLCGIRWYGWRTLFVPLAGLLGILAWWIPDQQRLWSSLHGLPEATRFVGEDASGVVLAATPPDSPLPDQLLLWVNGKGHSWLPYHGVHTLMGAIPVILHPAPKRVGIVGLGSGNTAWGAGCRPQTQEVVVWEICFPQHQLLAKIGNARPDLLPLHALLSDPRVSFQKADGRLGLAQSAFGYDVIEADADFPWSAGAGNLYSLEFFQLCAERLAPGGLMCSWGPTPRVAATFLQAFPFVVELFDGEVLIGSNTPIPIDPAAWQARLNNPAVRQYLGDEEVAVIAQALRTARPRRSRAGDVEQLNYDLFPRDEFQPP